MAIDFKQKLTMLKAKDVEPLTEDELNYIKTIEDYYEV
jgi:hypothetical protein